MGVNGVGTGNVEAPQVKSDFSLNPTGTPSAQQSQRVAQNAPFVPSAAPKFDLKAFFQSIPVKVAHFFSTLPQQASQLWTGVQDAVKKLFHR